MSFPEPKQSLTGPELESLLKQRPDRSAENTGSSKGAKLYQTTGAMFGIPGRDHASCLLYLQTVEANHRGDVRAHHGGQHMRWKVRNFPKWEGKYGSRLWDGTILTDHDDFDCIEDLEALGLLVDYGTGFQPMIRLTKKGHEACSLLISERSAWEKKPERES